MDNTQNQKTGKLRDGMLRYGVGRTTFERIAQEACASIKVGRTRLYDYEKIDKYLASRAR